MINQRRALVAEDDRALADIMRLSLVRAGYDVLVAHDGQKALNLAREIRFDVIVSDLQMPRLNGEQFLTSVRAGSESSAAKLILCSAKAYELGTESFAPELNLTAVFYKPFSLCELINTLQAAIEPTPEVPA
ncbi:MAG: response regulator [Pirellulaceae bacterium]|nr:response regulator [Pirellulaceae bacterium]